MKPLIDQTGRRFGRLTVIGRDSSSSPGGKTRWITKCDDGNIKSVRDDALKSGRVVSCGCFSRENTSKRTKTHGATIGGMTNEYMIWQNMRHRCGNPDGDRWSDYGGRGIVVCQRWENYQNFIDDMGPRPSPRHSIDRMDNDGPYSPENCRWTTPDKQATNKRNSRRLTLRGETLTVSEWAARLGVSHETLRGRLKLGWSDEKTLTTNAKLLGSML